MNIIDMHCHILPGLDDGAQSLEEAVRALQEAKKQGIDQVILTPHHYPDSDMPIELIFQTMKQLEDAIQENEIGIKLYPGHECLYYTDLPEKLDKQEVLTLAGSRYVLVEFLENVHYREILYGMRQLKEAGYNIEAQQNKGYHIVSAPDVMDAAELKSIWKPKWVGCEILYFDSIDSTNTKAQELAEKGYPSGTLVVADKQIAGKGRRGRNWESPSGCGIFMTLMLKPDINPNNASMLTLVSALAVAKALADIFELDYEKVSKKVHKRSSIESIVKKVDKSKADELRNWMETNEITTGINIDEDSKRYYPYGDLAAQVIGFCGSDNQGLDGVEAKYDD